MNTTTNAPNGVRLNIGTNEILHVFTIIILLLHMYLSWQGDNDFRNKLESLQAAFVAHVAGSSAER